MAVLLTIDGCSFRRGARGARRVQEDRSVSVQDTASRWIQGSKGPTRLTDCRRHRLREAPHPQVHRRERQGARHRRRTRPRRPPPRQDEPCGAPAPAKLHVAAVAAQGLPGRVGRPGARDVQHPRAAGPHEGGAGHRPLPARRCRARHCAPDGRAGRGARCPVQRHRGAGGRGRCERRRHGDRQREPARQPGRARARAATTVCAHVLPAASTAS